jgi:pyrimidine operon attenuation protein/uracil phosphoribosyltransferase
MTEHRRTVGNAEAFEAFADRVARWAVTLTGDPNRLAFVGIRSRGEHLAERIRSCTRELTGAEIPLGILDITLYRDDLDEVDSQPVVRKTSLPFNVKGRTLILVDDVLNTGRTARAALAQIIDFGRPKAIKLAVLVDRGNRELPIQPDIVGVDHPAGPGEDVQVRMVEEDGEDEIVVIG